MKINIDIDMTPEEARKLMGLPDVEPLQQEMMEKLKEKIDVSIDEMSDPELFVKRFMPMGMQGMEQVQEFFSLITNVASNTKGSNTEDDEDTKK